MTYIHAHATDAYTRVKDAVNVDCPDRVGRGVGTGDGVGGGSGAFVGGEVGDTVGGAVVGKGVAVAVAGRVAGSATYNARCASRCDEALNELVPFKSVPTSHQQSNDWPAPGIASGCFSRDVAS